MPQTSDTETPGRHDVGNARSPAELSERGWRDVVRRSLRALATRNMSLTAAGIAFYVVWAFFPALVVLVMMAALLLGKAHVLSLLSQVRPDLPEAFNVVVMSQLDALAERSRGLSIGTVTGALLLATWSGMRGVHGLMAALNTVYGEEERRSFWQRQLLALWLSLMGGVFVVLALALIIGFAGTGLGIGTLDATPLALSRWPILVFGLMLSLSVVYRHAPCREVPKWRWVTWGATATALIWMLASLSLSYYAAHYGSFNPLLGSLASVMLFLLWCYLTVLAVLLGAQINVELERHTVADTSAESTATTAETSA